jgi:hypothetical protein
MTIKLRSAPRRSRLAAAVVIAAAIAAVALPSAAGAETLTFENTTPITIPDLSPANPYPSTIDVGGFTGGTEDVDATVENLQHDCQEDVSILMVGPERQGATILMSNSGSCTGPGPANTFTFDDEAGAPLPCTGGVGPVSSGTYRPTRDACSGQNPAAFPPPASPGSPFTPVSLAVFDAPGSHPSPNGSWDLFVVDEVGGDVGTIAGGWSLTITASVQAVRTLTLDATKDKVRKGRKVLLSGQLDSGEQACESGQTIELQRKETVAPETAFYTFGSLQTDQAGNFRKEVKVKRAYEYRAQVLETATCGPWLSNTEKVKVKKPK